jgi:phage shock protein C
MFVKPTKNQVMTEPVKKLYRSTKDSVIAGICGGLGNYLNVDPVLIRVLWAVFFLLGGAGLLAYIIAWIIIPEEPVNK